MMYQISSGQGPAECKLAVAKLLAWLQESRDVILAASTPGREEGTYRSVRILTDADLSDFVGSVQWICQSPFRPHHKRKNWFIDFSECAVAPDIPFDPEQVVFSTFRSSGKGGQHVNKVESGVRAINMQTGEVAVCTDERSQHANKVRALARLKHMREQRNSESAAQSKNADWHKHTEIVRGNARRVFEGMDFMPSIRP